MLTAAQGMTTCGHRISIFATLQLRPRGHALRSHSLHSLAQALIFVDDDGHVGGSLSAYTESILLSREALQLRPVGHSERAESLSDLACGLLMSFSHNKEPLVLDEALELFRENLKLCPSGHLQRDTSLNRLAVALLYRFQDQGDFATLAELIFMHREVLLLRPVGHPLRYVTLDNLAVAIRTSFSLQGFPELLSDAIALHRKAVDMVSKTHPDYARITCNLAEALVRDFKQRGVLSILDESITLLRQALLLLPIGNDAYWVALHRLAKALLARFEVDKNRDHLLESIALHREHLKLGTLGQDYLQDSLGSLGRLLCKPECQSWEEALELFRKSVEICPYGAPARAQLLSDMSLCFLDPKSPFFDFSEGLSLLCEAHSNIFAHVNWRLRMASLDMQRVEAAYKHLMSQDPAPDQTLAFSTRILQLYDRVISLSPRAANFGLDHDARLHAVVGSDQLVRDAVARALFMNRIDQAVEILEGGRGLFWTQTLRLRATTFDGVPEEDHKELVRLLNVLDHGASPLNQIKKSTAQRERDMEARRLLGEQVEALITRIRGYPGLDRFLLSPTFLTLLSALPDGFVAIVNASKLGHHALLLNRATGLASNLELKPLQFGFDPRELRTRLPRGTAFYAAEETEMSGRGMRLVGRTNDNLYDVLSALWNSIALPVINALQLQVGISQTTPSNTEN
jgi:tetratricopeptide (TPR) repeat protein